MTTWYNSLKPEDANVMCLLASFCWIYWCQWTRFFLVRASFGAWVLI
jgi:hypothetical protein